MFTYVRLGCLFANSLSVLFRLVITLSRNIAMFGFSSPKKRLPTTVEICFYALTFVGIGKMFDKHFLGILYEFKLC